MSRTYTFYLAMLDGAICVFFVIHGFFLGHFFCHSRTVHFDVMQGFLIGVGLAFVTTQAYARIKATKVTAGGVPLNTVRDLSNGLSIRGLSR